MSTCVATPQSICRLGVARCEITPPVGMYHRMWGAASHDRSTGVHRPLTATAAVFQPAEKSEAESLQVVLAVDHCLLWGREMDELLTRISSDTGLTRDVLTVAFSHTHGAGLMDTSRAHLPGGELIAPYLKSLASKLSQLLWEARQTLRPATIVYGSGRCALAAERDFWDAAREHYVCGFNPQGTCDDTVLVARATDEQGRTLATVVNYACHPTTLAWENTLISPDYPGAMREVVEGATRAPCLFLQGASGDVGPREGFVGATRVADANGRQLGYAVLAALENLPPPRTKFTYRGPVVSGATLGTWSHETLSADELATLQQWRMKRWTVDLPYREGLPNLEQVAADRQRHAVEEQESRRCGNAARASELRALVERADRQLTRLGALPRGPAFPMPVVAWQMGDAVWLAVEGELYNVFQRELRQRYPRHPLLLATIANGSRPSYLPMREAYGKGLYQESIAVVAPGSLESLLEAIAEHLKTWLS